MRLHALWVASACLLIAADPNDEAARKELKMMQGTWDMVSGEDTGEKLPESTVKNGRLTIAGDRHTVHVGEVTIIGTHKVDPGKEPKEIDTTDTEGPFKGKTTLGIYKLDGDQFTVCFAPPDKDRPKEFTTKSGTGVLLHVWKPQKR